MSFLKQITRGAEVLPPRITLSGPEGVGKSTFAADAPMPLFISQEDGLTGLDHVQRFSPKDFGEIIALLDELQGVQDMPFQTLVIDTVDWLERSIHQFICKRDQKGGIEDYGYGKGYKVAEQELVLLLTKIDALRHSKKIGVILLSHVQIKPFSPPGGATYDRYEMKGHKAFTGILREWPDACLFATHEVFTQKERGSQKEQVIAGSRVIHTVWSPGWDAKNRLGLPATLPLLYADFAAAVEANRPDQLRTRFVELLKTATFDAAERKRWEKIDSSSMPSDRLKDGIQILLTVQPS